MILLLLSLTGSDTSTWHHQPLLTAVSDVVVPPIVTPTSQGPPRKRPRGAIVVTGSFPIGSVRLSASVRVTEDEDWILEL